MVEEPATDDKESFTDTSIPNNPTNNTVRHPFLDIPKRILREATGTDNLAAQRPKALGYLRTDLSGAHAPRHTAALHRHARTLDYQYIYTIYPPEDGDDPLAYALRIAAALNVDTLIIYDLSHVDNHPGRACTEVNIETVCPPITWARAANSPNPNVTRNSPAPNPVARAPKPPPISVASTASKHGSDHHFSVLITLYKALRRLLSTVKRCSVATRACVDVEASETGCQ